ncbi:MAG: cytochrome c [Ectothiorhodospiraceae bacterium]|jgi:cytochrome c553
MRAKVSFILGLCLAVAGGAQAAGDPAAGQKKATTCLGCHGVEGYRNAYPAYHVPRLGGQHAQYIVSALKEYKSGKRQHGTMRAQATTLSEEDMQDIAAYFEQAGK